MQTALRKPGPGQRGRVSRHLRMRLLDALSWLVETSQLSIVVRNAANGRCLVSMFIPPMGSARALAPSAHLYIFCVRLLQLLVQLTGQCEGLYKRNGQQYGSHAFSFLT